jgi:hypothetical protein
LGVLGLGFQVAPVIREEEGVREIREGLGTVVPLEARDAFCQPIFTPKVPSPCQAKQFALSELGCTFGVLDVRVWGLGFVVGGLGHPCSCQLQASENAVHLFCPRFRFEGLDLRVQGAGSRVQVGFRV